MRLDRRTIVRTRVMGVAMLLASCNTEPNGTADGNRGQQMQSDAGAPGAAEAAEASARPVAAQPSNALKAGAWEVEATVEDLRSPDIAPQYLAESKASLQREFAAHSFCLGE